VATAWSCAGRHRAARCVGRRDGWTAVGSTAGRHARAPEWRMIVPWERDDSGAARSLFASRRAPAGVDARDRSWLPPRCASDPSGQAVGPLRYSRLPGREHRLRDPSGSGTKGCVRSGTSGRELRQAAPTGRSGHPTGEVGARPRGSLAHFERPVSILAGDNPGRPVTAVAALGLARRSPLRRHLPDSACAWA
jgi:hypothetical protein